MIEDELNYPDTMKKHFNKQEYKKWVDETELGKVYDTFSQRFTPQHVYCYPSTSEPSKEFLCIGGCWCNNGTGSWHFYIKRNKGNENKYVSARPK